jgi:hypothetical protein
MSTRSREYVHECEYRIWGSQILASTRRTLYRGPHTAFQGPMGILTIWHRFSGFTLNFIKTVTLLCHSSVINDPNLSHIAYIMYLRSTYMYREIILMSIIEITCEYRVFIYLWVLMRYILVEYEYGSERAHEYSYTCVLRVYTCSIPWNNLEIYCSDPAFWKFGKDNFATQTWSLRLHDAESCRKQAIL